MIEYLNTEIKNVIDCIQTGVSAKQCARTLNINETKVAEILAAEGYFYIKEKKIWKKISSKVTQENVKDLIEWVSELSQRLDILEEREQKLEQEREQKVEQKQKNIQEQIEKNLSFAQKVRAFKYSEYDYIDYQDPEKEDLLHRMGSKTIHLGIRVPKKIKERFFDFCHNEKVSAKKVIIYLVENFM